MSRRRRVKPDQQFIVTFGGRYHAIGDAGKPVERTFECDYRITEKQKNTYSAVGCFMRFGKEIMAKKFPDFNGFAKVKVVSTVVVGKEDELPEDIELMSREELLAYIADMEYEINASLYPKDGELRIAILAWEDDEQQARINQDLIAKRVGATVGDINELEALNALNQNEDENNEVKRRKQEVAKPQMTKAEAKQLADEKKEQDKKDTAALAEKIEKEDKASKSKGKSKAEQDLEKLGLK